jgi:hypothetical protein
VRPIGRPPSAGRAAGAGGWRDAALSDLAAVELQALLNLRNNPGYTPRSPVVFMIGRTATTAGVRSRPGARACP